MANLKDIRNRITSVNSTKKITSAMKMVAASKLRKSQDAIIKLRPYATKLHDILEHISSSSDISEDNIYMREREIKNILLVIITSSKGLCGAFNTNAVKLAEKLILTKYNDFYKNGNLKILTIGKKADEIIRARGYEVNEKHDEIYNNLSYDIVRELAEDLMTSYVNEKYDKIILIYNQFRNAATQILINEQFLPVEKNETEKKIKQDYIFEPTKEVIADELIPNSIKIQLYKAVLESYASEHGARMTAMHQATDNATELIRELNLNYNKARQAAITNEILEIVSGANALNG